MAPAWCKLAAALMAATSFVSATTGFQHFVTRSNGSLYDGSSKFKFVSFNIPDMLQLETRLPGTLVAPNDFEIHDALQSIALMNGKVARTYTFSVCCNNPSDDPSTYHISANGVYSHAMFNATDRLLYWANKLQVRLIIPMINNWEYHGGVQAFAKLVLGAQAANFDYYDAFFNNETVIKAYLNFVKYVLNRTNPYTGVQYKNDKAILAWEIGNELGGWTWDNMTVPPAWIERVATFIKQNDPKHLVKEPHIIHNTRWAEFQANGLLTYKDIDLYGRHYYWGSSTGSGMKSDLIFDSSSLKAAAPTKVFVATEFGFVNSTEYTNFLNEIVASPNVTGALAWSLRYRSRNGGFYTHSEGNGYFSYHFPGFPYPTNQTDVVNWSPDTYEPDFVKTMIQSAAKAAGTSVASYTITVAPQVFTNSTKGTGQIALSWTGSAGAASYNVIRNGVSIAKSVSDGVPATTDGSWKVLYADKNVKCGQAYKYAVTPCNSVSTCGPISTTVSATLPC
ncbi:glycoside hydrolase superfamily [Polychytrium aggregatum]|uniref:glycoside hydrolase superfamily n=1 Tax=Polychytrium aggregatum TaxID=110093 RepID=UPI0022FE70B0|nr:glycoside hydrolase superfamily [Polychytrium aggregatum]KAI9193258.1 glycoside hydrolase superfamily [Polychytrium aggregatum]